MRKLSRFDVLLLGLLTVAVLTSGMASIASGMTFTEPPPCAGSLLPIPGTVIKAQLFVANSLDTFSTDYSVTPPQVGVIGVDVFLTGKCNKRRHQERIQGSRVFMSTMRVGQTTVPSDLVGLMVEKSVVDPSVEETCFDPALIPGPVVGYAVIAVDDFTNRGYFLVYTDPYSFETVQTMDYAIETEAKVVGLYCAE